MRRHCGLGTLTLYLRLVATHMLCIYSACASNVICKVTDSKGHKQNTLFFSGSIVHALPTYFQYNSSQWVLWP